MHYLALTDNQKVIDIVTELAANSLHEPIMAGLIQAKNYKDHDSLFFAKKTKSVYFYELQLHLMSDGTPKPQDSPP
jgi:L-aminopeptidase/D-esterase-like protein